MAERVYWDAERMDAWMAMFEENVRRWHQRWMIRGVRPEPSAVWQMMVLLEDMVLTLREARLIETRRSNVRKSVGAEKAR